jgi:hypothetical protein
LVLIDVEANARSHLLVVVSTPTTIALSLKLKYVNLLALPVSAGRSRAVRMGSEVLAGGGSTTDDLLQAFVRTSVDMKRNKVILITYNSFRLDD